MIRQDRDGNTDIHRKIIESEGQNLNIDKKDYLSLIIQNKDGNTPLYLATMRNKPELVRVLFKLNPIVLYTKNKIGLSPLHLSVQHRLHDVLNIFLESELDMTFKDDSGRDILDIAKETNDDLIIGVINSRMIYNNNKNNYFNLLEV